MAEHLGASSRRPHPPFPALMAGETPGRVPVYTALAHPITPGTEPSGVKLSTITRHGDASTLAAHRKRRVSAVCRRRAVDTTAEWHRWCFMSKWTVKDIAADTQLEPWTPHPAKLPTRDWNCQRACSYPCHAQKTSATHRWCVVRCQVG